MVRGRRALGLILLAVLMGGTLALAARDDDDAGMASASGRRGAARTPVLDVPADDDDRTVADVREPSPLRQLFEGEKAPGLALFASCKALLHHLRTEGLKRVTAYGLGPLSPYGGLRGGAIGGAGASASGQAASGLQFSTTNVQEPGVDEPDLVKNDEERVLTLFDGRLRALVADGRRLRPAGEVVIDGAVSDAELLLLGDRAVVLWPTTTTWPAPTSVQVTIIDVSDPDRLEVVSTLRVDGSYVSARAADGGVWLVVRRTGPALPFTYPSNGSPEADEAALADNRRIVERATIEDWLGQVKTSTSTVPMTPCTATYAPEEFSGFGTTTVLRLEPARGAFRDSASVLADGGVVYASPDHLYVASSRWPEVLDGDPNGAAPPVEHTDIHRFDITDRAGAVYEASGSVPGHLPTASVGGGGSGLAQWALSEHQGDLRVATTIGGWSPDAESVVTVLRRGGDVLVPVGALSGLGRGEQLYGVRFMADRAYVVTYRKVDPLFVLDLSDPTTPRLLGELKVPGFSWYLHPVGENRLLGIGQDDSNEDGFVDGTQVSLFDVSDVGHPRRLAHLHLGERGTISEAESDHRAFTWWPQTARAILPLSTWDHSGVNSAAVLDVDDQGLRLVGKVSHPDAERRDCTFQVRRSRVIETSLYTFSSGGVWMHALEDLAPLGVFRYDNAAPTSCPPPPPPEETTTTTTTTTTQPPVIPLRRASTGR